MSRLLVTGADGFIGARLSTVLESHGHTVIRAVRRSAGAGRRGEILADMVSFNEWKVVLENVDCVLHLAGRAHVVAETEEDPLATFRRVNVGGTIRLAEAAASSGVKRFVFLSSIGVNGSLTHEAAFTERDPARPREPYAVSKWEAEQSLTRICNGTGLELVTIRPPLVYGPGVKGNLLRLLRLVAGGIPLPLASIHNQRSFVGLENLCDLLSLCASRPEAAGELFVAADGMCSTPELLELMGCAMGRPARLWPCPSSVLGAIATLVGKSEEVRRLCGSLVVDSAKARSVLGWSARVPFDSGMRDMADWFVRTTRS